MPLNLPFVDYEKTFNSVDTWTVLDAMGDARTDSRNSTLIKHVYKNSTRQVVIDEDTVTNKIKI